MTSARHNCTQLSQKVAAMWHDLKGIWGWRCKKRKFSFQQLDSILLGHIYSYVCQENKHATFLLHNLYQLSYKRKENCINNYVSFLQYMFLFSNNLQNAHSYSATSFMLLAPTFNLKQLLSSQITVFS